MGANGQQGPRYDPDQVTMLAALKTIAQQVAAGNVTGFAVVATMVDQHLIGHHLTARGDLHLVRGLLQEVGEQMRELAKKPPSGVVLPDGSVPG